MTCSGRRDDDQREYPGRVVRHPARVSLATGATGGTRTGVRRTPGDFAAYDGLEEAPERAMNRTSISEIILLGFEDLHNFKYFVFSLFLVIYLVTMAGNVLIIVLVSASSHLQSPMFFFLGHLSISDMILISNIIPNMLHVILLGGRSKMSLNGCVVQYLVYGSLVSTECLLLTSMSYDRYVAICKPLHYITIMDHKCCMYLVTFSWLLGITITLITMFFQTLWFCGPNVIDHYFCDLGPLLELSCSDTTIVKYEVLIVSSIFTIIPFVFITVTYICIFMAIMKITSIMGRQKTFSTCSSHLTVVCAYYGALFVMYVVPSRGQSLNMNKGVSLMYTVVTPLFNPIIYSLRNQEMRTVMWKCLSMCKNIYKG
ncbi:olfactory receptor 5G9-like [Hyperolius riggenbachi]|uniref:olfactory receptor 5G9-like n=1 Tax=Hyperolius riggenbachi TaxID=752182 RepID=UPI0035A3C402